MAIYSNNQEKFSDYLCVFDSFGFTKKINFQKKVKKFSVFLQNPLFKQVFLCYNILINYIGGTLYYV